MKRIGKMLLVLILLGMIGAAVAYALTFVDFHRKVSINGEITRNGKPLEWQSDNRHLFVKFVPVDRDADPNLYEAETDAVANKFRIDAIPTGVYFVSIQMNDPDWYTDLLKFAYPIHNQHLRVEVKENRQHIIIDLPQELPPGSRPSLPGPVGAPKDKRGGKKKDTKKDDAEKLPEKKDGDDQS